MWGDTDEFEKLERRMDAFFNRVFAGLEGALFDLHSMSLKPLFRVEVSDEMVTVTLDLPRVTKQGLVLNSTEEVLSIDAKLKKPVKLRVGRRRGSHAQFEKYSKKIILPVAVDPKKATAKFVNGILVVKLPRVRAGKAVKIE